MNRKLVYLLPLILLAVMMWFLVRGLSLNPRDVPSPLVGKPAPEFTLPLLNQPGKMFSTKDKLGQVWLFNVWASWCSGCRTEHENLLYMKRTGRFHIVGMDYKDQDADAQNWLNTLGNPYEMVAVDRQGNVGIDWGVYGVPETFVVDKKGVIRYKYTGPITPEGINQILLPLVEKLEAES